jgi:hypothetical protein
MKTQTRGDPTYKLGVAIFSATIAFLHGVPAAWATGQDTTPDGHAFSSACAGLGFSSSSFPGNQVNKSGATCQSNTSATIGGTAESHVSAAGVSPSFSNSANGMATPLQIKLDAHNSGSTGFPGAQVNGGWNDQITLSMLGQSGDAVWVTPIQVSGQLNTTDPSEGFAQFWITAYKDHSLVAGSSTVPIKQAAYDLFKTLNPGDLYGGSGTPVPGHYGAVISTWVDETVAWAVGESSAVTLENLAVNQTVQFAIPFTWGVPFDLGIFALAVTGQRSSSAQFSTSDASFQNTVTWGGPGYVLNNGAGDPVTGFTITSTGANYQQPFSQVPESPSLLLLSLALGTMGMLRRLRR